MRTLIAGANAATAKVSVALSTIFNNTNCERIYHVQGNYISWDPEKTLNAFTELEAGDDYLIIMKTSLEVDDEFLSLGDAGGGAGESVIINQSSNAVEVSWCASGDPASQIGDRVVIAPNGGLYKFTAPPVGSGFFYLYGAGGCIQRSLIYKPGSPDYVAQTVSADCSVPPGGAIFNFPSDFTTPMYAIIQNPVDTGCFGVINKSSVDITIELKNVSDAFVDGITLVPGQALLRNHNYFRYDNYRWELEFAGGVTLKKEFINGPAQGDGITLEDTAVVGSDTIDVENPHTIKIAVYRDNV